MPDLSELERRITATKAALDGARAGYQHSPNAEIFAGMTPEQRVKVSA